MVYVIEVTGCQFGILVHDIDGMFHAKHRNQIGNIRSHHIYMPTFADETWSENWAFKLARYALNWRTGNIGQRSVPKTLKIVKIGKYLAIQCWFEN